jgi:Outer membrane protein beta-barrel domain
MRSVRFGLLIVLLGAAKNAGAQVPSGDAAAAPAVEPAQELPAPEPGAPAPAPESAPDPVAAPASAPAPAKIPEGAPEPKGAPTTLPAARAPAVGARAIDAQPEPTVLPPWIRAHRALTLEARLGLLLRPESSEGFDDETHLGADVEVSGYVDLSRELAAGLELSRASLGRGAAVSGQDTVSTDFSVTSAMLGVRAYPKRSDMVDLYVGLQLGVGLQHVSSAGTRVTAPLRPGAPFSCSAYDSPGFQIGGGVGARFMLSPRWGIGARLNATGRRLTSDVVGDCAQGLGSATTITASLGLGYDFDLDP